MAAKKYCKKLELDYFDAVSQVVQESKTWIDLKHISNLSGVPLARCRDILARLIDCGQISKKLKTSVAAPKGTIFYAKTSMALSEETQKNHASEFKHAISRFSSLTGPHDSKFPRAYVKQSNHLQSLAMLYRKN